jgi:nucleoside-diphosphate-sugar epimerase
MTPRKKTALVVGATGLVGRSALELLATDAEWDVIAVSRRKPELAGSWTHVPIDLLNAEDCAAKAAQLASVTHVFFAAYVDREDNKAWIDDNGAMFFNLVEAIEPIANDLVHINVVHGTKWYGSHLGPFKTPAREDDARHMPPNFYYDQWDWLLKRSSEKRWSCSSSRPGSVCGFALGNPMNLAMVIAMYAVISRELGLPLRHPGTPDNWRRLYEVTDASLLAKAMIWMATEPRCANEAFNITNGDFFRWENLWPKIARYWGMELEPHRHINLAKTMEDKGPLWERIVQRYGLKPYPYHELVQWSFGDHVFTPGWDGVSDTSKCRRYGFLQFVDTEQMLFRIWEQYRAAGILPD